MGCTRSSYAGGSVSPVRISDKMPDELLERRTLDIRLWQTVTAMRCLRDKGVTTYYARDIVGEIDQRMQTNSISPMLNILHNRGYLKCLTPARSKHRRFQVITWDKLDKFQVCLAEHPEQLNPPLDWLAVRRQPLVICDTDEHEVFEEEETVEPVATIHDITPTRPHSNGRKKVGWFRRTFTNAEVVEELRETNRRLDRVLEVWE